MVESIGRPLRDDEIVHHIDGDPLNNHITNLQIMTPAEHQLHHRAIEREARCQNQP
jgi:hypothetical protein